MSLIKRPKIPFLDLYVLLTVLWDYSKFAPKWFEFGTNKLVGKNAVSRRKYMKVAAGPSLWAPEPSTTFDQPEKN